MNNLDKRENLCKYLSQKGMTVSDLVDEVETVYGERLLVVATGSIIEGLGNRTSDIDLMAVVRGENISQLPIMSYRSSAKFDVEYYAEVDVSNKLSILQCQWPPANDCSYELWKRYIWAIRMSSRIASGLSLLGNHEWEAFFSSFSEPWFVHRLSEWWYTEAIKIAFAAKLLSKHNPLLASFRYCDAVVAALSGRATSQGQVISGRKWLPEKLKILHDSEGLKMFNEAMHTPLKNGDPNFYLSHAEDLLNQALRTSPVTRANLSAQLWYADGVNVFSISKETIVMRWNMRGCSLKSHKIPTPVDRDTQLWTGPINLLPPEHIVELFCYGMLWLSLVETKEDNAYVNS